MKGKIIRGIGGFYYVHAEDGTVYECRAKGIFRKDKRRPLVGDDVLISPVEDSEKQTGNVDALLPRRSELLRPAVANVDQALVVFAMASPKPNLNLLDRFLLLMKQQHMPVIICFNKTDLSSEEELTQLPFIYEKCGSPVLLISAQQRKGLDALRAVLRGKTTVVAGPSGVGKSSLTNLLQSNVRMETGAVSRKIERGRHTTRHTELLVLEENTFFLDTPGFSSLYLPQFPYEEVKDCYEEFVPCAPRCRFQGCLHISEPGCAVKEALAEGTISRSRYENYVLFVQELKNRKRY